MDGAANNTNLVHVSGKSIPVGTKILGIQVKNIWAAGAITVGIAKRSHTTLGYTPVVLVDGTMDATGNYVTIALTTPFVIPNDGYEYHIMSWSALQQGYGIANTEWPSHSTVSEIKPTVNTLIDITTVNTASAPLGYEYVVFEYNNTCTGMSPVLSAVPEKAWFLSGEHYEKGKCATVTAGSSTVSNVVAIGQESGLFKDGDTIIGTHTDDEVRVANSVVEVDNSTTTLTTLNPSDKEPEITLSNGNLTADSSSNYGDVCGDLIRSSGKAYFEVVITAGSTSTNSGFGGVVRSDSVPGSQGENCKGRSDYDGWCIEFYQGNKVGNHTTASYGSNFPEGSILGVAVDFNTRSIWFAKNNAWFNSGNPALGLNPAFTNIAEAIKPYLCLGSTYTLTVHFKASDLTYAPPEGFDAWETESIFEYTIDPTVDFDTLPEKIYQATLVEQGVNLLTAVGTDVAGYSRDGDPSTVDTGLSTVSTVVATDCISSKYRDKDKIVGVTSAGDEVRTVGSVNEVQQSNAIVPSSASDFAGNTNLVIFGSGSIQWNSSAAGYINLPHIFSGNFTISINLEEFHNGGYTEYLGLAKASVYTPGTSSLTTGYHFGGDGTIGVSFNINKEGTVVVSTAEYLTSQKLILTRNGTSFTVVYGGVTIYTDNNCLQDDFILWMGTNIGHIGHPYFTNISYDADNYEFTFSSLDSSFSEVPSEIYPAVPQAEVLRPETEVTVDPTSTTSELVVMSSIDNLFMFKDKNNILLCDAGDESYNNVIKTNLSETLPTNRSYVQQNTAYHIRVCPEFNVAGKTVVEVTLGSGSFGAFELLIVKDNGDGTYGIRHRESFTHIGGNALQTFVFSNPPVISNDGDYYIGASGGIAFHQSDSDGAYRYTALGSNETSFIPDDINGASLYIKSYKTAKYKYVLSLNSALSSVPQQVSKKSAFVQESIASGTYTAETIGEGPEANSMLLIKSDTTNGSTTFVDSSGNNVPLIQKGTAYQKHSTTYAKFGSSSIHIDTTTSSGDSYLSFPLTFWDIIRFGDFTVEFWYRRTNNAKPLATVFESLSPFSWYHINDNTTWYICNTGVNTGLTDTTLWHHIALVRASGAMKFYLDGVGNAANITNPGELTGKTTKLWQAWYNNVTEDGYFDEFRISNVARYTSNFTPPSVEFPLIGTVTIPSKYSIVTDERVLDNPYRHMAAGLVLQKDMTASNVRHNVWKRG
jgi:hypothetical protein